MSCRQPHLSACALLVLRAGKLLGQLQYFFVGGATPTYASCCTGAFIDPFDELVFARAGSSGGGAAPEENAAAAANTLQRPSSGLPRIAPDSSLGPLALDPLAEVWPCESGSACTNNGKANATAAGSASKPPPGPPSQASTRQQDSQVPAGVDAWDLEDLMRLTTTQSTAPRTQSAASLLKPQSTPGGPSGSNRATSGLHSASTGDLLGIQDGAHFSPRFADASNGGSPRRGGPLSNGNSQQGQQTDAQGGPQGADVVAAGNDTAGGSGNEQRELFIYALPLSRDKLVFLPIAGVRACMWPDAAGSHSSSASSSSSSSLHFQHRPASGLQERASHAALEHTHTHTHTHTHKPLRAVTQQPRGAWRLVTQTNKLTNKRDTANCCR